MLLNSTVRSFCLQLSAQQKDCRDRSARPETHDEEKEKKESKVVFDWWSAGRTSLVQGLVHLRITPLLVSIARLQDLMVLEGVEVEAVKWKVDLW